MKVGMEKHLIPVQDYKLATNLGMSDSTIRKHIVNGPSNFKKYIEKYERKQGMRRLAIEDREREERRRDKLDAKQRKEQERLQMIEKHRVSSKRFKHLCENDIFPKVVK